MNVVSAEQVQSTSGKDSPIPLFVLTAIVATCAVAVGVSYFHVIRIALILVVTAAFFSPGTSRQSPGLRFLFVCLGLSLSALAWVLTVSTEKPWWKAVVVIVWLLSMRALRHFHRDLAKRSINQNSSRFDVLSLFATAPAVLAAQGWTHFIPLAVTAAATAVIVAALRYREIRFPVKLLLVVLNTIGALASREWLTREDIRIWISFDQNFRASLATGLTRWGWTDWNAAAGQPVRYHWLSEATAGLFSRLTGIDEFDSVVRFVPILGIIGALFLGATLLQKVGVAPFAAWTAAALTVGAQHPFSVFSIGTLWGAFLGFGILAILATLLVGNDSVRLSVTHLVATTAICVVTLMSQSSVGLTAAFVVGVVHLFLVLRRRASLLGLLALGLVLAASFGVVSRTLLRSPQESAFQVNRVQLLQHGIVGLPESFKNAFSSWVEPYSQSLLVPLFVASIAVGCVLIRSYERSYALLITGSYTFAAWLAINLIRIGGHEERFIREGVVVASLFGVGGFISFVGAPSENRHRILPIALIIASVAGSTWYWQSDRSATTYIWVHLAVIVATVVLSVAPRRGSVVHLASVAIAGILAGTVLGFFHESAERSLSIVRRDVPSLASVNGDSDLNTCFDWVRYNTPPDTVIASNMWRIPNAEEQKYFLVSQRTKRRLVIDGPDYVRNVGAFADRSDLESLKNDVDNFVGSPTVPRLYALRETGAGYFILDLRRPHSSRLESFAPTVMSTRACAVLAL
jgi:hypothetical protein